MIWSDFNTCSVADDGEHSWIVIEGIPASYSAQIEEKRTPKNWMCISSEFGANLLEFADRESAKRACEEKADAVAKAKAL
jgi:hypothetical protein